MRQLIPERHITRQTYCPHRLPLRFIIRERVALIQRALNFGTLKIVKGRKG